MVDKRHRCSRESFREQTIQENIDIYADLVERNIEVMAIIEEGGSEWRKLQDQLKRNQDDIRRFFKELDSKNQSLKLSAAEVVNLKRKIKTAKRDNTMLRDEVKKAGEFEPEVYAHRPDLMMMEDEEVKNKIVAISKVVQV